MAPTLTAQHRPFVLTICPGPNGYRLAFVGGSYFETIAEFPTREAASAAYTAAKALTSR